MKQLEVRLGSRISMYQEIIAETKEKIIYWQRQLDYLLTVKKAENSPPPPGVIPDYSFARKCEIIYQHPSPQLDEYEINFLRDNLDNKRPTSKQNAVVDLIWRRVFVGEDPFKVSKP